MFRYKPVSDVNGENRPLGKLVIWLNDKSLGKYEYELKSSALL